MKKCTIIFIAFFGLAFGGLILAARAKASDIHAKLPYEAGQSFVVSQGFHSPPTHIKKDDFAIDFTQNGCDAYGKVVVASIPGKAWIVQESGYNGGYGTQLLVLSDGNIVTRYAHMIPDSIIVKTGYELVQGDPIGQIGNTGLVAGTACAIHPGAHLHFAMDINNPDGSLTAKDPEPISGYTDITENHWYISDNSPINGLDNAGFSAILLQNGDDATNTTSETVNSATGAAENYSSTAAVPSGISLSGGTLTVFASDTLPGGDVPPEAQNTSGSGQRSETSTSGTFMGATMSLPLPESDSAPKSISPFPPAIGGVIALLPQVGSVPLSTSSQIETLNAGDASSAATTTLASSSPASFALNAPLPADGANSLAIFDSTTLAVDLAWASPQNVGATTSPTYDIFLNPKNSSASTLIGTTASSSFSYHIPDDQFGGDESFSVQAVDPAGGRSPLVMATVSIPNWFVPIQTDDDDASRPSWYSDNWYDLGTGFMGTIRALTLEGLIDSDQYGSSSVTLQEFTDADYTTLDHTFPIEPLSFSSTSVRLTVPDLKIPLSADKYYRLTTVQDYQNRSVILAGTEATGTAMWDDYVSGVGGLQHFYSFYPYISAIIDPRELAIATPTFSGSVSVAFDAVNSKIDVTWPTATDSDEPFVPPTYQANIATSTAFDPAGWQSMGSDTSRSFNVVFGNSYIVGVRALNDFGQFSDPLVTSWNFPSDYNPVPSQLDHSAVFSFAGGAQKVTFLATTTATAIDFWSAPVGGIFCCSQTYLSVYKDQDGAQGEEIPSGNPVVTYGPYSSGGEQAYVFSSPITFSPGSYDFVISIGPSNTTNPTALYGSPNAGAYFRLQQAIGP